MVRCINVGEDGSNVAPLRTFLAPPEALLDPGPRGVNIRVVVPSAATNFQYTCVETAIAAKTLGPSPHQHDVLDEFCLVTRGTLSILVGETVHEVPEGAMFLRPHGIPHTFWNATGGPVNFLDMFFNQNFDEYLTAFFEIAADVTRTGASFRDPGPAAHLAALDAEFGITQFPERRAELIARYGLDNAQK